MQTVDARLLQLVRLFLREEAEGAAYLDADLLADPPDQIQDLRKVFRISLVTACRDDIETGSPGFFRSLSRFDDLFLRKELVGFHTCLITGRLRAEFTVLLTSAASCIDDRTKIDTAAGKFLTDLIRTRQKKHRILILRADQRPRFLFGDRSAIQNLFRPLQNLFAAAFHCKTLLL